MSILIDRSIANQAITRVVETSVLAKRRLKVLNQTSASQIDAYERCKRIWANSYLFEDRTPPSPAQARGTDVDDNYVQPYLKTGEIKQGQYTEILKAVIPFLPKPRSLRSEDEPPLMIQHEIKLATFEGGPTCIGYVDFAEMRPNSDYLEIGDLKTTSDFRYCKTETELANNTQMVVYAQWGYENDATGVSVAHVYGRTKGKARGHKIAVHVQHEDVAERWAQRVKTVREMVGYAATIQAADELSPDTSHCMDYGGCAFRSKCGFTTMSAVKPKTIKTGVISMGSDLLAQLRAAKGGLNGSNGAVNGSASVTPIKSIETAPDSVLPPDAPSRTSTPEEIETVEKAKRGRPKKAKTVTMKMKIEGVLYSCEFDAEGNELSRTPVEVAPILCKECNEVLKPESVSRLPDGNIKHIGCTAVEAEVETPVAKKTKPTVTVEKAEVNPVLELLKEKRGAQVRPVPAVPPVLFVDCMPVKSSGKFPVPMEEWLGPIAELAAATNEVQDVRLISYTSKGVLASAIRDCLDTCPAALLIDSRQFGADEILAALIPHASLVVRGIR